MGPSPLSLGRAACLAALLLFASCTATPDRPDPAQVQTSTSPGALIDRDATFGFLPGSGTQGTGPESAWIDGVLRAGIVATLEQRGLRPVSGTGRLGVLYIAAEQDALDPREVLSSFRLLLDDALAEELPVGTLLVLVTDGPSGRVLWRASVQTEVRDELPEEERRARLERHVAQLFETLPVVGTAR